MTSYAKHNKGAFNNYVDQILHNFNHLPFVHVRHSMDKFFFFIYKKRRCTQLVLLWR